ncbi:heavy-metal-associated domain-containing protein [Dyella tabacisoli]|uniref:Copper chaperone n=1 Tax=Dyella tabacisoli TaxID=2282381 RepID=A0A369UXZ8_9GAMM|nr:heavy-metal-associated domain-containing protein [Dyella tabacisoli]RDD83219.1 copper chaperone [Dyella tabacisoli]
MSQIEWSIGGMTCGGCANRLKRALEQADGVMSAEITIETKRAKIHFDEARLNAATLKALIENVGFVVTV